MTTFNTRTLIELAQDITVIVDGSSYDADYTRNRIEGDTFWHLAVEKDAPPEYRWMIPDQDVTIADTGMCAVKDSDGEVLLLAFTRSVPMLTEDFVRLQDQAEAEEDGQG